jgi:DNA polymerase (family 10)
VASALPRNAAVVEQLELLADMLELEGEQAFRVLAYRRAAQRVRESGGSIAQLALDGRAKELPGIGTTIQDKIVQIVRHGEIEAVARRRQRIPSDVVTFMRLPGLGPKTARRIWQELGISTLAELRQAAEQERLRTLTGLGPKIEENVLRALKEQAKPKAPAQPLLGEGLPAVLDVVADLRAHSAAEQVSEAGSVRRRRETFRDLDIIATATDAGALIDAFAGFDWVVEIVAKGGTKATVISHRGLRFDLRVVPPECYGNLLQHFTGSKDHNVAMREEAVRRGLSISEYGIAEVESGEVHTFSAEEELYGWLGYQFVPPELRENAGELEAARRGELPALVEEADVRGDLHAHTTWSADGKSTMEEMALAAKARGYSYLAITDHSHYLRDGRLEAQAEELAALNVRLKPLRLLHGIEVNIRANGTLDVPDEVLSGLDWVVASIHAAFSTSPTERVLAALENPHVHCIGHLTGRKLNKRGPMDVDLERVCAAAVETGTALEINSQPDRLDLRDADARLAGERGVRIVVSTDSHSAAALGYMQLGIGQARRAWLTKEQVVNTRPWSKVKR